ncbi:hypothetical protein HK096_002614 [Nowakowskiella sp. JEL0078]|nr:hypothetical protein HK096_002614 [Nowakowskiella sp. JEL0078]
MNLFVFLLLIRLSSSLLGVCYSQTFIPTGAGTGTPAAISNYQRSQCFAAAQGMLAATPLASVSNLISLLPCNLSEPLQTWEVLSPTASATSYEIRLFNSNNFCVSDLFLGKWDFETDFSLNLRSIYISIVHFYFIPFKWTTISAETNNLGTTCPSGNLVSTSQLYIFSQSTAAGTGILTVMLVPSATPQPLSNLTTLYSAGSQSISTMLAPTSSTSSSVSNSVSISSESTNTLSNQTLLIALACVSGFALIVLLVVIFLFFRSCRRKRKVENQKSNFSTQDVGEVNIIRGATNANHSFGNTNSSNSMFNSPQNGVNLTAKSGKSRSTFNPNAIQHNNIQRQVSKKIQNDNFVVQNYYPTKQSPPSIPTILTPVPIQRLNSAQKPPVSEHSKSYSQTSISEVSVFERLRAIREERSKSTPQKPTTLYLPATLGTSIASNTPPHSPTSTDGGYIAPYHAIAPNTSASVIVLESEHDVDEEVYTYETSLSNDSRRLTKSSADAYSQRSSSLGFPISQRNHRLNTTGPASIFDVLSEAGVEVKSGSVSDKSVRTGAIIQTNNMANAVNTTGETNLVPNMLELPVSVQIASTLSDSDDVRRSALEIATVIWPYISDQDDELVLEQGDLVIILNKFDDGWGRGWSKKSKKTGFFPLGAITTLVNSDVGDFSERGSSVHQKSRISNYNDADEEEMERRIFGPIIEKSYMSQNISDLSLPNFEKFTMKEDVTPLFNFDEVKTQIDEYYPITDDYELTDLDEPPRPPPRRRTKDPISPNSFTNSESSSTTSLFHLQAGNSKSRLAGYGR